MRLPIALIVDDGSPVNLLHYTHPRVRCEFIVPNSFTRDFGDLCVARGVRGKFSVVPMPTELGRLDQRLNYVPQRHVAGFLDIARRLIARQFDITPEILTHSCACNLRTGGSHHVFEDVWFERASLPEMTDYIALSLRILKNVGLPANGVTSPWSTGITRERDYARAISAAQWRVHRRRRTWYFLHCLRPHNARRPWVSWRDRKAGRAVVSIPANTNDVFWATMDARSRRTARAAADEAVDSLLTRDGRSGQLRELFDKRMPLLFLTHWQSLFSDGRAAGLAGLERVLGRIERTFGDDVEWTTCSRLCAAAQRAGGP